MDVFREGLFQGQGAIVTGGGTGMGYRIAEDLAALGANVVIASRKLEQCQAAADEMNQKLASRDVKCGKVYAGSCNIRKIEDIVKLVDFAMEKLGRIDLLVNNAGGQFLSAAEDISPNGWRAVVETNLTGTFLLSQQAYTRWMADHGGSIVNIVMSSANGYPQMAHSSAARAGVRNMTKTLSLEWVSSGTRVNCVAPGVIYTDSGVQNYGEAADFLMPLILKSIPARRLGTSEEVSACTLFLLSKAASFITGQTVAVDGGGGLTYLPLGTIDEKCNLPPFGSLPSRARL